MDIWFYGQLSEKCLGQYLVYTDEVKPQFIEVSEVATGN